MILLRLSGHSGAGKTPLINLLPQFGVDCKKVIRYTSRLPRMGEIPGEDFIFKSREYIKSLPEKDFLVGPVRNIVQAFDLRLIEKDLRKNDILLVEIYPDLWPALINRLEERIEKKITTASVFMTAVDPAMIRKFRKKTEKAGYISSEVYKILLNRNKDNLEDIKVRAHAAQDEILEALSPEGEKMYSKILHSAPEGPDGEDEWTREKQPVGQAKVVIEEFIALYKGL
jgi:hypothetical protein